MDYVFFSLATSTEKERKRTQKKTKIESVVQMGIRHGCSQINCHRKLEFGYDAYHSIQN